MATGPETPETPETPAALGYRWPAEWQPHEATWLTWPHNPATWPGKFSVIPRAYARLVETICRFEPARILATAEVERQARSLLPRELAYPPEWLPLETNDSWIRDYGPTFLLHDALPPAVIDWEYNAWGGKYPPYDLDNRIAAQVAERLGLRRFEGGLTLEGGAIEGNGEGLLLTTRSSVLDQRRNPSLDQATVERRWGELLGAGECVWLSGDGLAGDDTDGHIDQLARFVAPGIVVAAVAGQADDPNAAPLAANVAMLRQWRGAGRGLQVIELPTPRMRWCQGRRLPCSYCNFIFVNGGLIVPQFDDPQDQRAVQLLRELLPDREVVGVDALDLIWGLGAFHCLSQQQPR